MNGKIYQYMLKNSASQQLTFYMTRIVPFTTLKVDLSSIEFLKSLYRDMRQFFMDRMSRLGKENSGGMTAPSCSQPLSSSQRDSSSFGGGGGAGMGTGSSGMTTTDNEKLDDELKSSSPELSSQQRPFGQSLAQSMHWQSGGDRRMTNKSSKSTTHVRFTLD